MLFLSFSFVLSFSFHEICEIQMGEVVKVDGGREEAWRVVVILLLFIIYFFNLYIHCGVSSMLLHSLLS